MGVEVAGVGCRQGGGGYAAGGWPEAGGGRRGDVALEGQVGGCDVSDEPWEWAVDVGLEGGDGGGGGEGGGTVWVGVEVISGQGHEDAHGGELGFFDDELGKVNGIHGVEDGLVDEGHEGVVGVKGLSGGDIVACGEGGAEVDVVHDGVEGLVGERGAESLEDDGVDAWLGDGGQGEALGGEIGTDEDERCGA